MAIAFKEWEVVCNALASGRQAIILRKGGIHEGREGFSFAHDSFFLFPTKFHAQLEQVREGDFTPSKEWEPGDLVEIKHHVRVLAAVTLKSWEQVSKLLPYHIYTERTIKDRFDWTGKGMAAGSIHLAWVRVCHLSQPWKLKYEKRMGGCRSWVEVPEPPQKLLDSAVPVLDDDRFSTLAAEISEVAGVEIA